MTSGGAPHILGGAPTGLANNAGYVRLYRGDTGAQVFQKNGTQAQEDFGASVCFVGQPDLNGGPFFAVGARLWDGPCPNIFGNPTYLDVGRVAVYNQGGDVIRQWTGRCDWNLGGPGQGGTGFGWAISRISIEPSNSHIQVGSFWDYTTIGFVRFSQTGSVQILDAFDQDPVQTFYGQGDSEHLGQFLGPVGDIDQDGNPDFAAGSAYYNYINIYSGDGFETGESYLLSSIPGGNPYAIAPLGRVNGDEYPEFAFGHPGADGTGNVEIWSMVDTSLPLDGFPKQISATQGGDHYLFLHGNPKPYPSRRGCSGKIARATLTTNRNRPYLVMGSMTGTSGFSLCGTSIPLSFDSYTSFTISHANDNVNFFNTSGNLDGRAEAEARVRFPADPGLAGLSVYHAFILDPACPDFASNTVRVEIIP